MRGATPIFALALLVAASSPPRARPPAGDASLQDVLRLSGAWVQRFADDMVFVVADERYEQAYRAAEGGSARVEHRTLRSEMVFVQTPEEERRAGYPWVQFRDVVEVDGVPLADHRGRLERLFRNAGDSANAQASAMIAESARYNIGRGVRTVNVPSFALFFLYPANQSRFRFDMAPVTSPEPPVSRPSIVTVRYRERGNPTMIRSTRHEDLPASGIFQVESTTGRVLTSRIDVRVDRHWATTIEVTYGPDEAIGAWVPLTLHERAGRPVAFAADRGFRLADDEILDCTATYSNFRRFRTDARIIRQP